MVDIPFVIIFLLSLTGHEWAHARVAVSLGDPTPRQEGRLTWNVFSHISLPGLVMFLIAKIGWAKPVRINTNNLRCPRTDMLWISLAGPLANLTFALTGAIIWRLFTSALPSWAISILYMTVYLNLMLAFFNLIPIPPLDGAKIIAPFLPLNWAFYLQKVEPWGFIILLVLLNYLGLSDLLAWWGRTAMWFLMG